MTEETKQTPYQKWYEDHKKDLSDKRKKRYREDPDYREAAIARAANRRRTQPQPSRAGQARFRTVNGKKVEVFRIGEVGKMIGRSDQTIRDWEAEGVIPKPTVESAHRYYTMAQVKLMKGLADLIDVVRFEGNELLQAAMDTKKAEIHSQWSKE